MNDLIDVTGCRKMFTLSELGHDDDYFLKREDMSEAHWNLLMACHHQGRCDEDTEEAAKYFQFPSDDAIVKACEYLIECGVESERFLIDDDEPVSYENIEDDDVVMQYYLWMLAGDIQRRSDDD